MLIVRITNEFEMKGFLELLLLVFYMVISNFMLSCSNSGKPEIEKQQSEVVNYIPQLGISVVDNRLVWSKHDSLPVPFANIDGSLVISVDEWENRRNVLLKMLEEYVYGTRPRFAISNVEELSEYVDTCVSDNAITYTARIYYDDSRYFNVRITRPGEEGRYPVIMRYESNEDFRFPIETECIKNKRYVIVALNHLTVAPDVGTVSEEYMNETKVVMAWAYAASLIVDYLETLGFTNCTKITIAGMSRTGKSAVCAGI